METWYNKQLNNSRCPAYKGRFAEHDQEKKTFRAKGFPIQKVDRIYLNPTEQIMIYHKREEIEEKEVSKQKGGDETAQT